MYTALHLTGPVSPTLCGWFGFSRRLCVITENGTMLNGLWLSKGLTLFKNVVSY